MSNNELLLLLALTGVGRIPHLEEEIFENSSLTKHYLIHLEKPDRTMWANKYNAAQLAYFYSKYTMKEKWAIAEKIIRNSEYYWDAYKEYFKIDYPA